MIIANIAGGRPDDASLRDSLPYRSPRQPGRLPRHCQVSAISLSGYCHCHCRCHCQVIAMVFAIVIVIVFVM